MPLRPLLAISLGHPCLQHLTHRRTAKAIGPRSVHKPNSKIDAAAASPIAAAMTREGSRPLDLEDADALVDPTAPIMRQVGTWRRADDDSQLRKRGGA